MTNPYSQLGPDDFQAVALELLPTGPAWPRDLSKYPAKFFGAIGDTFAAFSQFLANIVDVELNPATASELLPAWEQEFGLPDPCNPSPQTVEQRRAAVIARKTDLGNLSRPKYIAVAAALGFPITITEYKPYNCTSACNVPISSYRWRFVWQVNAPAVTVGVMNCTSPCNEPLRWWGNTALECAIKIRNRPSRTVTFSYGA